MSELQELTDRLIEAAKGVELEPVEAANEDLIRHLHDHPADVVTVNAAPVLEEMRANRHFEPMKDFADVLISSGRDDFKIRQYMGQSLVDTGGATAAVGFLREHVKKSADQLEIAEATGLLARASKDIFIKSADKSTDTAKKAIRESIRNYGKVYKEQPSNATWHGVNLVALQMRAKKEGIPIRGFPDPKVTAQQIVETIEQIPEAQRQAWDWASMAEAGIALGDQSSTDLAVQKYLHADDVSAFSLKGTLRQFEEVWELDRNNDHEGAVLAALQARLLEMAGGDFSLTAQQVSQSLNVSKPAFERVFGPRGAQTYEWHKTFMKKGRSVGLVSKKLGQSVGTCFVVRGGDFYEQLGNELLVLTNNHVVSDNPELYGDPSPILPEQAEVSFELDIAEGGAPQKYEVESIIWSSLGNAHDATLLRLQPALAPDRFSPMSLTDRLPVLSTTNPQRVYIIGHPGGRGLSFAMQNNELLDYQKPVDPQTEEAEPKKVHYYTPTEPGSSGSPAMNETLDVIALHHSGSSQMERLNGMMGTYEANEGIWIKSIRNAASRTLSQGNLVWGT